MRPAADASRLKANEVRRGELGRTPLPPWHPLWCQECLEDFVLVCFNDEQIVAVSLHRNVPIPVSVAPVTRAKEPLYQRDPY